MKYSIDKITTLIGARRNGTQEAGIEWLLTDSRSLCFPEETLFFALKSERNDGHLYIPELYRRGVRNFVVERIPKGKYPDSNFLRVVSPLEALQRLAERHRDEFDIPIVGITGSNGKTMVKEWLYQVLSPQMSVCRSPRSYNSQIGVPLSVWLLDHNSQVGLFEAGISKPGEMRSLCDIIQPTIGILTSLGAAHQENFRSLEEKCHEKMLLFSNTHYIIYNSDDDIISRCLRRSGYKGERIAWSRHDRNAALFVKSIKGIDGKSTLIDCTFHGKRASFCIPFLDDASIECSLATAAAALHLGVDADCLKERMAGLEPVAMRMEVKEGLRGCTIINDTYNSDLNSLDIALDFMNRRAETNGKGKTLILSDMAQSGETAESLCSKVSDLALKRGVERFIGVGPMLSGCSENIGIKDKYLFENVGDLISSGTLDSLKNETILIKGARKFGFDHITEWLEQKRHETTLEVNLTAIADNLNHYRAMLSPKTKIACMVKADAYGAGAIEVAKTLQDLRADYLAVAVADEGAILRRNGITAGIMVMNPETTAFKTLFDYDLEPEVYSFRIMDSLIKAAEKEGITNYPVHIKIDTGMHRLGFNPEDIDRVISRLHSQNAIIPRSVFSHFVGSDSDDFDSFSSRQFEIFDRVSLKLQAAFKHKILRHIDNSAGIEHFPERQLDMCRLGLGLYGIDSRTNKMLNTVSCLKTIILQLRQVPKDETVGYSRKGVLLRDSLIAALPIGYADGLDRHLGNGNGYCLINGQKAPYVGNICMDIALVDATGIECKEGDQVEIFGRNLPVTVLSDAIGTIPYEVLTGVSGRVKRIYVKE